MRYIYEYPQDLKKRPIKTADEIISSAVLENRLFLVEYEEFIKLFNHLFPYRFTRRTLQLYCSASLNILPPPVHIGGHVSYYLYPEHTDRLAVAMILREQYRLRLKTIATILENYPQEHYRLILNGIFTAQEIANFALNARAGDSLKDFIFQKVCQTLEALNGDFSFRSEKILGKRGLDGYHRFRYKFFSWRIKELAMWLQSERFLGLDYPQDWSIPSEDTTVKPIEGKSGSFKLTTVKTFKFGSPMKSDKQGMGTD